MPRISSFQPVEKLQKIVLVDDDEHTNFLNKTIIRHARFADQVVAFTEASSALEYLEGEMTGNGLPDLIFLDINMPLMDGWDFIEKYAQFDLNGNAPRVIMLTSSINPKDEQRAESIEEIDGFRSKPLSHDVLKDIYNSYFS